jgi:hypothetical protein
MSPIARCFISYAHQEIDEPTLAYILANLRKLCRDAIAFIDDRSLRGGTNLDKFMDILKTVDGVLVILTPAYKQQVLARKGGVYKEFTLIINRLDALESQRASLDFYNTRGATYRSAEFCVIPILFSGTPETSVPDELSRIFYEDFRSLRASRDAKGRLDVRRQDKQRFRKPLQAIVNHILAISRLSSATFLQNRDELFEPLFRERKDELIRLPAPVRTKLFVKTHAYQRVRRQHSYILIGRKGTGKSTVRDFLSQTSRAHYIGHIDFTVNEIHLDFIYGTFKVPQIASESATLLHRTDAFAWTWEVLLYIKLVRLLMRVSSIFPSTYRDAISRLRHGIAAFHDEDSYAHDKDTISADFVFCIGSVVKFLDHAIKTARSDEKYFFSDVKRALRLRNLLLHTLGQDALTDLGRLLRARPARILLSLDGFDTKFGSFRDIGRREYVPKEEIRPRILFEVDWLRGFLQFVLKIKANPRNEFLYSLLDICATVPKDRFMEVLRVERDAYVYKGKFLSMNWSGPELMLLLCKRVEVMFDYENKKGSMKERLEYALHNIFEMPRIVKTKVGNMEYDVPLFLYLLRHTFMRPRDLLYYCANLFAFGRDMKKKGLQVSNEAVRTIVSKTTWEVVVNEFIGEFEETLINVKEVLRAFQGKPQTLEFAMLEEALRSVDFHFAQADGGERNLIRKIRFLYEIGFLGIDGDQDVMRILGLGMRHAFYFNEGEVEILWGMEDRVRKLRFVVHPVFCEFLMLDVSKGPMILEYTWEYIIENEARLHALVA